MISVVTVVLNAGDSLMQTIQSVLDQKYTNWELVVKDGGSTDGSIDLIPEDPRVKLISTPDNGIYDAMNQALGECSGSFVCYLNAGDFFFNDGVLGLVSSYIENNAFNFYYGYVFNRMDGWEVRYPERLSPFFLYRNVICHQAQFISKDLLLKNGLYSDRYKLLADYDFYLRANARGLLKPCCIKAILASYHGGGVSAQPENKPLLMDERSSILSEHFGRWQNLIFSVLHGCTFVSLRGWIIRSNRGLFLKRLLNRLNHLSAKF